MTGTIKSRYTFAQGRFVVHRGFQVCTLAVMYAHLAKERWHRGGLVCTGAVWYAQGRSGMHRVV